MSSSSSSSSRGRSAHRASRSAAVDDGAVDGRFESVVSASHVFVVHVTNHDPLYEGLDSTVRPTDRRARARFAAPRRRRTR